MKKFLMCKLSQNVYHWQIVIFVSNILRETTKTFNNKKKKKIACHETNIQKIIIGDIRCVWPRKCYSQESVQKVAFSFI